MKLIGHEEARSVFEAAWQSGKLHHAWLLTGPRGVGKRTFADAAARMVLAGTPTFASADETQGAAKFDAAAHPDYRLLQRTPGASGKLRAQIVADEARSIGDMLSQYPSMSEWRVVTIDSACELNSTAANSLLKNIEEPPRKTVFFLVCHNPGRLLATIRSRCRVLPLRPLSAAQLGDVIARETGGEADTVPPELIRVAGGAPGRALRFQGLEIAPLVRDLDRLADLGASDGRRAALTLSAQLGKRAAQERYEAFLDLVPAHIAAAAKAAAPADLEAALALWEEASELAAQAIPRALDAGVVTFQLARMVARLPASSRRAA